MKLNPGFKLRTVLDQPMLVAEGIDQINFNKMITFNSTAAYLWETAEAKGDFDVNDLAEALVLRYGIDSDTAQNDAQELIDLWNEHGLIED